jgi:hypothetical protein
VQKTYQAVAVVQKDRIIYTLLPQFTLVQFELGTDSDSFYARQNYTAQVNGDGEFIISCEAFGLDCLLDTIEGALLTYSIVMLKESNVSAAKMAKEVIALPKQQQDSLLTKYVSW